MEILKLILKNLNKHILRYPERQEIKKNEEGLTETLTTGYDGSQDAYRRGICVITET